MYMQAAAPGAVLDASGAAPMPFCSAPGSAGNARDDFANALAAPAAMQIGAVAVLGDATSGSAPVLTDASADLCSHEGVVAGVSAASAGFGASVIGAAPAPFCPAAGSGSAGDAPLLLEIEKLSLLEGAAPAPFCSAAGSASDSAGDAQLLLEIEKLSLLEGATLGAARLVPGVVRAIAAELDACIAAGGGHLECSSTEQAATAAAVLRSDGFANALVAAI